MSFAAGRQAHALHSGAFVWADNTSADFSSTAVNQFLIRAAGGVGINTASPAAGLHVVWDYNYGIYGQPMQLLLESTNRSGLVALGFKRANYEPWEIRLNTIDATPKLEVAFSPNSDGSGNLMTVNQIGDLWARGTLTINGAHLFANTADAYVKTLTIIGGSDVAEPFAMSSADIPKGAVVIIDDTHPGQLKLSEHAYDTRVAGIVSGANGINPGLSLKQKGVLEDGQNVALSGRVYALADASNGAIQPGDLLTTSSTPGHAMKVTDHAKAQGAILGKAMSSLAEGQGLVLVLVTLQ